MMHLLAIEGLRQDWSNIQWNPPTMETKQTTSLDISSISIFKQLWLTDQLMTFVITRC